ncbi:MULTISPECIES: hypothetical protein [unclassified Moorena]|uniref:hypothetical protein n=1 Tax=unclassified Moorena TaxID=2683338 RepID=UPI0025DC6D3D|nr:MULTISPECIES: hypothetical protein [unclassified Moorena]
MAKRPRYANNLGQKATLREQLFNLQPSTFNLQPFNLQPSTLQPSTLQPFNPSTLQPFNPSTLLNLCDRYLDQLANFLSLIG